MRRDSEEVQGADRPRTGSELHDDHEHDDHEHDDDPPADDHYLDKYNNDRTSDDNNNHIVVDPRNTNHVTARTDNVPTTRNHARNRSTDHRT